jgi:hypothetical protein
MNWSIINRKTIKLIDKLFIDILELKNWSFIKIIIKTFYQIDKVKTTLVLACIAIVFLMWLGFVCYLIIQVIK